MKTIRQLLRQPMKTAMGILLVALSVGVLCLSLGQIITAGQTDLALASTFQTAAFPGRSYTRENDDWVLSYAQENPKVVKAIHSPGLVSAYLPDLTPDNYTAHRGPINHPDQFPQAMLVVRLTHVEAPVKTVIEGIDGKIMTRDANSWYKEEYTDGTFAWKQIPEYTVSLDEYGNMLTHVNDPYFRDRTGDTHALTSVTATLTGVVEEIVGLEEGYTDCTGYTAKITLTARDLSEFVSLGLAPDQRFLVYTTNYTDDWLLRNHYSEELDIPMIKFFDPEKLIVRTTDSVVHTGEDEMNPVYTFAYDFGKWIHGLKAEDLAKMRVVTLPVSDPSNVRDAAYTIDDSAEPLWTVPGLVQSMGWIYYTVAPGGETPVYPVKEVLSDQLTYSDINGETHTVPANEYHARYARPTMTRLDGTVEDFLGSPEGAMWKQTLGDIDINNHAFPMVGVDNLQYIAGFLQNTVRITQGRDFTAKELKKGEKVCILSEEVAEKNGLNVGDTISPQFYEADKDLPGQSSYLGINPTARFFHSGTTRLEEAETFTIVGLYRKDIPWDDTDGGFTPNTIFAPKSALPQWQQEGFQGMFRTVILHGRGFQTFMETAAVSGLDEQMIYFDNGYTAMAENLNGYRVIAGRVFAIGLAMYAILMTLYLLLYPTQQRKTLVAMERLGASYRQRVAQVEQSSLGILIPGTVLGAVLGALLWNRVVQALLHSSGSTVVTPVSLWILAAVAAAQLALMALLTYAMALPMSRSRGISDRR